MLRRVRAAEPRERTLATFTGGALAGWFVQSQTLFYVPSIQLQHMLLLAFAAHMEASAPRERRLAQRLRTAFARAGDVLRARAGRLAMLARIAAAAGRLRSREPRSPRATPSTPATPRSRKPSSRDHGSSTWSAR